MELSQRKVDMRRKTPQSELKESVEVTRARMQRLRDSRISCGECPQCGNFKLGMGYYCTPCYKRKRATRLIRMHSFDDQDFKRYLSATICDWCGKLFKHANEPHIDHDHNCCEGTNHCWFCTRGLLHYDCNQRILWAHEFIERECGFTSPQLREYREKFPVPRVR